MFLVVAALIELSRPLQMIYIPAVTRQSRRYNANQACPAYRSQKRISSIRPSA